jgi:hypothetical protein
VTTVAYLDPVGGLSGDMLLGALLDAGADRGALDEAIGALGLDDVAIEAGRTSTMGLVATRLDIRVEERTTMRSARALLDQVNGSSLPPTIRAPAHEAVRRLAAAEASIHGADPDDVVLHELGGDDTLVDICGAFALLAALGAERVVCAPLPMGRGLVTSMHGPLPVPAPATLALLEGVPVIGVDTPGELVTPTGAAIVSVAADAFGPMPAMTLERTGMGAGSREHADRPNVLRVLLGSEVAAPARSEVLLLEANLDDLVPELAPDAQAACIAAGALDTWLAPVQMKKGRPGFILSVLARPEAETAVADALLRHSSTLGVRVQRLGRYELERATLEVRVGDHAIRVKIGLLHGRVVNVAPEHDDCVAAAAALGRPVKEVWAEALTTVTMATQE